MSELPETFVRVCPVAGIAKETGVVALVHGRAVAVFRTHE